jgi:titin
LHDDSELTHSNKCVTSYVSLFFTGAAQVVTESRSELSQFQYLEQKTQVRQEVSEEHTTQAPVFTSAMKSVELKEGQKAHFECRIIPVSDATLKVQWLHNGAPIKQGTLALNERLHCAFLQH